MRKTAVAKVRWRSCGALHDLSDGCGRRDHAAGDEAGNLSIGIAVFAQQLARVFAKPRRRAVAAHRRAREVDRATDRLGGPGLRVDKVDDHPARKRLRMGQRFTERMHRTGGHPGGADSRP